MNRKRNCRRGASVVELSLVLWILLMVTMGMLDVGRAIFLNHVLSNAACQGARRAIVHGQMAAVEGVWGPKKIGPIAATTTGVPIVDGSGPDSHDGIAKMLVSCNLSKTNITVDWNPDGSNGAGATNAVGANVRVTVTTPYTPFMPLMTGGTISAVSTMQIVH
jgi:Flp pilus assembly protein TadG